MGGSILHTKRILSPDREYPPCIPESWRSHTFPLDVYVEFTFLKRRIPGHPDWNIQVVRKRRCCFWDLTVYAQLYTVEGDIYLDPSNCVPFKGAGKYMAAFALVIVNKSPDDWDPSYPF